MRALACLSLLLLLADSPTTVVRPGETLADVAKRTLGDEKAAEELKALNGLPSEQVAAGATLKLPGEDRDKALNAIAAARSAVIHSTAPRQKEASEKLRQAEALFAMARYADANQEADGAWRLVREGAPQETRFSVEVHEKTGRTVVSAKTGHAVRVQAEGVTQPVGPGQVVVVEKGQAPSEPETPPVPPVLIWPPEQAKLKVKASPKGLGPVTLSWKPVSGARGYEVEVNPAPEQSTSTGIITLTVAKAEAQLPLLPEGRYVWAVRSLGKVTRSERSQARSLELAPAPDALRLEVKGTEWK